MPDIDFTQVVPKRFLPALEPWFPTLRKVFAACLVVTIVLFLASPHRDWSDRAFTLLGIVVGAIILDRWWGRREK